ncbi:MAG TPA: cytochrome c [Candidatus Acidoferrum sp.]|nr:cytochrome c [Candidatus Acidoferrum sp.]
MPVRKTRDSVVCVAAILIALVAAIILFPASVVRANGGQDSAATKSTFRTKCAMCHGQDGSGSEVGKSMKVPDLRSPEVQKLPDAELARVISDGKGGMPPFKSSLSEAQIHALVSYVRSLRQKK